MVLANQMHLNIAKISLSGLIYDLANQHKANGVVDMQLSSNYTLLAQFFRFCIHICSVESEFGEWSS
jgi:hypothetical protein